MERPEIKPTLQQISPALPDPYQFSEKIFESIIFMDENPQATLLDLSAEMLDLWSVEEDELDVIKSHINGLGELYIKPNVISSIIIFSHIYLTYYRQEDFADLENFQNLYEKFNKLMNIVKDTDQNNLKQYSIEVFNLDNIDDAIDLLEKTN